MARTIPVKETLTVEFKSDLKNMGMPTYSKILSLLQILMAVICSWVSKMMEQLLVFIQGIPIL